MKKPWILRMALLAPALALAPQALAGWSSLGAMPPPRRDGTALVFQNEQGTVALSVVAPDVVRVRFSPTQGFGRDHSYVVLEPPAGDPKASFDVTPAELITGIVTEEGVIRGDIATGLAEAVASSEARHAAAISPFASAGAG